MLTEVKNNYKSILKHFDFDESVSFADYKKQKLIEMAKSGKPRPRRKTKIGRQLSSYTAKSSKLYHPEFDKLIRELRPDWFESTSQIMKQKLIDIAKSGEKRPSRKTKEAWCLGSYTSKSSDSYCPKFDKLIRKLRPDWFESTSQIMRQKLITIAKSGAKRPHHKTKEGWCLVSYVSKSSSCYCPKFDKLIRKLRPDWFESTSKIMKQKLILMAKNGENRPSWKTKERKCLISYTSKSSGAYCPKFDKLIRKLRPDWFVSLTQIVNQKKKDLIQIAKSGAKKPHRKTKEGKCLVIYISKSSSAYCPKFDKLIRKLRPDWFVSRTQIVNQKKKDLIQIAKSGEKRPSRKTKEGRCLCSYTDKSSESYCPKFDKLIRKLRSDWFRKKRTFAK
jgi:hypothetical protein